MLFSRPKKAIGLDIGTHSVKAVQMSRAGGRLYVEEVGFSNVDRNQVNADPVNAHATAVREALQNMPLHQSLVVAALPGQTVVIRYPRITNASRDQMSLAVERETAQNIPYDLSEVFLDWSLLTEEQEGEKPQFKVLLVAAKHEVIDSRIQVLDAAEVECGILGVDSLALSDAAEACGFLREGETVALINIGLTSTSIHFIKDGISNFIRDVSWGAREMVQAIAKERHCEYEEAERVLQGASTEGSGAEAGDIALTPPPSSGPETVLDDNPFDEPSGASLLDPLDEELGSGDPFGAAPASSPRGAQMGAMAPVRDVLAAPLARLVSETRRSFDYYEHQLYERPVDRIILSGGIAHLPFVRELLAEELGVESVDVADPANSTLMLGEDFAVAAMRAHPAQFLVATGLAARGMAEL